MEDSVNKQNIKADKLTYGKWSKRDDQFADNEPLELIYKMFSEAKPELPESLNVIEFGSADGVVGEYFKKRLVEDSCVVNLSLLDVVKEHLDANPNDDTIKINKSLLEFDKQNEYDLGIVRSVFHYFSQEAQNKVIANIYNSIKPGGYFLSQNFVQTESDLGMYLDFNHMIGKDFQLTSEELVMNLFKNAGFEEVRKLGDLPVWHYTSDNLMKRYALSPEAIQKMRQKIEGTPEEKRTGFQLTKDGFTVPVPFKVFLMRKSSALE